MLHRTQNQRIGAQSRGSEKNPKLTGLAETLNYFYVEINPRLPRLCTGMAEGTVICLAGVMTILGEKKE